MKRYRTVQRTNQFFDKHNVEILPGMTLKIDDRDELEVVEVDAGDGRVSLGVSATNPDYLRRHPDADEEFYDLSVFSPEQLEIMR